LLVLSLVEALIHNLIIDRSQLPKHIFFLLKLELWVERHSIILFIKDWIHLEGFIHVVEDSRLLVGEERMVSLLEEV